MIKADLHLVPQKKDGICMEKTVKQMIITQHFTPNV